MLLLKHYSAMSLVYRLVLSYWSAKSTTATVTNWLCCASSIFCYFSYRLLSVPWLIREPVLFLLGVMLCFLPEAVACWSQDPNLLQELSILIKSSFIKIYPIFEGLTLNFSKKRMHLDQKLKALFSHTWGLSLVLDWMKPRADPKSMSFSLWPEMIMFSGFKLRCKSQGCGSTRYHWESVA